MTRWLAHDGMFWRRLAWLGAAHGPWWWMRYSPPAFGLAAALVVPRARRGVVQNLRRIRGRVSPAREALDVARTFTAYAGCLSEVLSNGSKNDGAPAVVVRGEPHLLEAKKRGTGIVIVTAHTAGWELAAPGLERDKGLPPLLVMEPERSEAARRLSDEARKASGLALAYTRGDPLDALSLLGHIRRGGAVAVQIDRVPEGMRGREVRLFGAPARVPEGPLRLAAVSGAPILPAFSARLGFRSYEVSLAAPIVVPRRPTEAELDRGAQAMADAMAAFLRANPTQWFHWGG
jgi:lauroyl/myristoyl acyltransferase